MASFSWNVCKKKKTAEEIAQDEEFAKLKEELDVEDHKLSLKDLEAKYNTNFETGLSSAEAELRLKRDGKNVLRPPKSESLFWAFMKHMLGGFSLLLWAGAIMCFVVFAIDVATTEAPQYDNLYLGVVLTVVVVLTGLVSYYQERKSTNIMRSFKKMIPAHAQVLRDGHLSTILAEDLVKGDVIRVQSGDRIPADMVVIISNGMKVDNSSLTGESEPQHRLPGMSHPNPLETKNLAFFSTNCIEGNGRGVIILTGDKTIMGRIAGLAAGIESGDTPIAKEIAHFVHIITAVAVVLGVIFGIIALVLGYTWVEAVVFLISIIVANVPEGLLLTVTIMLTLCAKRMAKKNCLVKNLEAVETLGSTTTICSDKTGTLTQNRMTVAHLWFNRITLEADTSEEQSKVAGDRSDQDWQALFRVAALCSRAHFVGGQDDLPLMQRDVVGDPSEAALLKYCALNVSEPLTEYKNKRKKCAEIPFNSTNKYQVSVHHDTVLGKDIVVMKGAPERVLSFCSTYLEYGKEKPMDASFGKAFVDAYEELGGMGERVIGFCDKVLKTTGKDYTTYPEPDFPLTGLRFVGLISLIDPPRAAVPHAVESCKTAGIKVIMITGDHPITAKAIARTVKIISTDGPTADEIAEKENKTLADVPYEASRAIVLHGQELKELVPDELDKIIRSYDEIVFARTSPQQKLIIVESCQRQGEIVAVTGDGVNDSPALKQADIGIAMGITGSDVSKEAADMILMDDNFASIVVGVEEGRVIFDNLKKTIVYTLTSNIPELFPFIAFVLFGIPLPLGTITVLAIDLGTDMIPAISLAYEKAEQDIMSLPPRRGQRLVNAKLVAHSYMQKGPWESLGAFFMYFFILAENGWLADDLVGIRNEWSSASVNDLQDSYGQEWTFNDRMRLQLVFQAMYFGAIVVTQWANLIMSKTRRNSVFKQGMTNHFLNFALVFELVLAFTLIYTPYLNTALRMGPARLHNWLIAIPFAVIEFVADELRKWSIRRNPAGLMYRETYY